MKEFLRLCAIMCDPKKDTIQVVPPFVIIQTEWFN